MIYVGVVDQRDFPGIERSNTTNILFHRPTVITERGKPKIRTNINCVHTLHGVDEQLRGHIDSWIRINRGFGVGKISFGMMDSNWTNLLKLKEVHGDFIDIVPLENNIAVACSALNLTEEREERCMGSHLKNVFQDFSLLEKVSSNDWY
jgi:hypothetical protein